MRKLILAAALLTFVGVPTTNAFAEASGAGCGAGTLIFKGQKGVLPQVLAVTVNGTFMNTFAISTGTMGCEQDGVVLNEHAKEMYVATNMDLLKQDMARGGGEYLTTLAALMEVAPADRDAFYSLTKDRFAALAAPADAEALLARLDEALAADPVLARYAS